MVTVQDSGDIGVKVGIMFAYKITFDNVVLNHYKN